MRVLQAYAVIDCTLKCNRSARWLLPLYTFTSPTFTKCQAIDLCALGLSATQTVDWALEEHFEHHKGKLIGPDRKLIDLNSDNLSDVEQYDNAFRDDTATKALHRLGAVMNYAAAMGLEVNSNAVPNARQLLGDQRHKVRNHPALPWEEVPKLYQWLNPEITTQRALMLYILTGGGTRMRPLRTARRDQFSDGVCTG